MPFFDEKRYKNSSETEFETGAAILFNFEQFFAFRIIIFYKKVFMHPYSKLVVCLH